MINRISTPFLAFCFSASTLLATTHANAQTVWSDPNSGSSNGQYQEWHAACEENKAPELAQVLSQLVNEARSARAADPEFLADLDRLVELYKNGNPSQGYSQPAPTPSYEVSTYNRKKNHFIHDDFADGDFTYGPKWDVISGEWFVDPTNGLRSSNLTRTSNSNLTQQQKLLQALLGKAVRSARGSDSFINADVAIQNSFKMYMTLKRHASQGALHFLTHQGTQHWHGYMLSFIYGHKNVVEISRRTRSGKRVLAQAHLPYIDENEPMSVAWTRSDNGALRVFINERKIIEVNDKSFRDNWTGLGIFNHSGDFSVRDIRAVLN